MCTVKDERAVLVCDVAIGRVRRSVAVACGDDVRYTIVDSEGTLVEATTAVAIERFTASVQAAIAEAQRAG